MALLPDLSTAAGGVTQPNRVLPIWYVYALEQATGRAWAADEVVSVAEMIDGFNWIEATGTVKYPPTVRVLVEAAIDRDGLRIMLRDESWKAWTREASTRLFGIGGACKKALDDRRIAAQGGRKDGE